jgi:hypothetical protein
VALMVSELYDALREAGVAEEKARAAAEADARHETSLTEVRADIRTLRAEVRAITGFNTALILLGRSFGVI